MTHLVCRETIWVIKVSLDQFRVRTFVVVVLPEKEIPLRARYRRGSLTGYVNRRYSRVPKCRKVNYIVKIAFKIALLAQRMQLQPRLQRLGPGPLRPVRSRSPNCGNAKEARCVCATYSLSVQLVAGWYVCVYLLADVRSKTR